MKLPNTSIRRTGGFTLIEVLIAIGIVAILAAGGLWVSMGAYRSFAHRSERDIFISTLQRARLQSMANINGAVHGVRVEGDRYTIFEDEDGPEHEMVPGGDVAFAATESFPYEVRFTQLSGAVADFGTITITHNGKITDIAINAEGGISW